MYWNSSVTVSTQCGECSGPIVSREEIVNSCRVEDMHDGTNYYR